jgi:mannose-6-phosphate isomerase-like protein (cupin superfamily)
MLYCNYILKKQFNPDELAVLGEHGLTREAAEEDGSLKGYMRFEKIEGNKSIKERLKDLGVPLCPESLDKIAQVWEKAMVRRLYSHEAGKVPKDALSAETVNKLIEHRILGRNPRNSRLHWSATDFKQNSELSYSPFWTPEEFESKLKNTGLSDKEKEYVFDTWKRTTKSGYNIGGLVEKIKGVAITLFQDRTKPLNQDHDFFGTSSVNFDKVVNGTGVVRLDAKALENVAGGPDAVVDGIPIYDFARTRKGEAPHSHPLREGEKQTHEVYCVLEGEAALLTTENNVAKVSSVKTGDLMVIGPDVVHCVLAIKGKSYTQVVIQTPSMWHFGPEFKKNSDYKDLVDENGHELTREKLMGLAYQSLGCSQGSGSASH